MVTKNILIALAISATSVASQVLPASAYGFTDFIKDQANNFQDRFISTQFNQKFVQEMSNERLNEFKKEYGERGYVPYVDAWCGDQIYAQGYYNRLSKVIGRNGIINGAVATWRFEMVKLIATFVIKVN
jgi:predicted Ser/Thr protein kinase